MAFLMTPEDVRRVVDDAIKGVRDETLRQVSKWVDANRNALTVDLSTGRYINIEDVLLYLFEAQSWPLTAETAKPMLPDVSWCDCNHPLYGPAKDRHLPSCRYGIVMDYLDIADPRREP